MESMNQDVKSTPETQANTASTPTQTGAANPGSTEAKFTQADVDRLINERLERADKRAERLEAEIKARVLKKLGLAEDADLDTTAPIIENALKKAESEKSEVQRLSEAQTKKDETIAALQKQLNDMAESRKMDLVEGAIRAKAQELKANKPDTVLTYIQGKYRDLMRDVLGEDGSIDQKKMDALMGKVKEEDATLFTPPSSIPGSRSNADGRHVPSDSKLREQGTQYMRQQIKSGF